jgi:RimJ/RimL family protein N-acetyltransferase
MIETERLLLRPAEERDAEALLRQLEDAEVMRYISGGETGTLEDAVAQVERMKNQWQEDGFGRFVVVRRADGAVVGKVGPLVWDSATWRNGTRREFGDRSEIELGWTFERAAWGNGFATEAALAARDWALREVRPRRLISLIHPENARSMRVAERIGEGYQHDVETASGITVQLWALPSTP